MAGSQPPIWLRARKHLIPDLTAYIDVIAYTRKRIQPFFIRTQSYVHVCILSPQTDIQADNNRRGVMI